MDLCETCGIAYDCDLPTCPMCVLKRHRDELLAMEETLRERVVELELSVTLRETRIEGLLAQCMQRDRRVVELEGELRLSHSAIRILWAGPTDMADLEGSDRDTVNAAISAVYRPVTKTGTHTS